LALPVRGDRRDPAVVVGARNSARHVLAGNEPALRVIRQPVRLAARPTPDADTAGVPAADDVTGNVTEQEVPAGCVPDRTLDEVEAVGNELELGIVGHELGERWRTDVENHVKTV